MEDEHHPIKQEINFFNLLKNFINKPDSGVPSEVVDHRSYFDREVTNLK
jgi:hypothetical protein